MKKKIILLVTILVIPFICITVVQGNELSGVNKENTSGNLGGNCYIDQTTGKQVCPTVDYSSVVTGSHPRESGESKQGGVLNMDSLRSDGEASYDTYYNNELTIEINGQKVNGWCVDPSLDLPKGDLDCKEISVSPGFEMMGQLAEQYGAGSDYDHAMFQLALRMMSTMDGISSGGDSGKDVGNRKEVIDAYTKIRSGDTATADEMRKLLTNAGLCDDGSCSTNEGVASKLINDNDTLFNDSYELAKQMSSYTGGAGYDYSEQNGGISELIFTPAGNGEGGQVTVQVTASAPMENGVTFTSPDATITSQSWSGSSGSVTLQLPEGQCTYTIEARFSKQGAYMCSNASASTQQMLVYLDMDEEDVAQTYEGSISSDQCSDGECCTESPITPGQIFADIHNCCYEDTHSEAREYNLDELFCYDEKLKVEYYWKKCGIEYYLEESLQDNEYCELYCTERVSVDIPHAITARSGRYFELSPNPVGSTTSSYIQGFKRCRVWIAYDKWEQDYYDLVDKQKSLYNTLQKLLAQKKIYETAKADPAVSMEITATASCSFRQPCQIDGKWTSCSCGGASGKSATVSVNYTPYNFKSLKNQKYQQIQMDLDKRNKASEIFDAIIVEHSSIQNEYHEDFSIENWGAILASLAPLIPQAQADCASKVPGGCYVSTNQGNRDRTPHEGAEVKDEEPPQTILNRDILPAIESSQSEYTSLEEKSACLEANLDECDDYFTAGEGADAQSQYKFDAQQDFAYSQVYLDDMGELANDKIYIDWKDTPGCQISGPYFKSCGSSDISGPRYSEIYKEGIEQTHNMVGTVELVDNSGGHTAYIDSAYDADKIFTHDAMYKAVCEWEEDSNQLFTLVPNGYSTENTSVINKTIHNQQYYIHLTTLKGNYETYWEITGLGEDGIFDEAFKQGVSCAGDPPSSTLTCAIEVEYEIVLTGYCNGEGGYNVTDEVDDCDPNKEMIELFTFKVVDPTNLFPTDPVVDGVAEYGYNWLVDEQGVEVLGIVEETGRKDKTYAPENMTYAFNLTPTDMRHIKNYNEAREVAGGYSDFTLTCNCPGEVNPSDGCVQCKSTFLEDLANGKITYNRTNYDVTGWANRSKELLKVRQENHW